MGIFWSCFWSVIVGCTVSYLFFDGPGKHEVIYLCILGVIIGLDSALSEIKNEIKRIEIRKYL